MTRAPHAASPVQPGTGGGPYMLTLCPLAAPVSIRFPEGSPLRQFRFFMTRSNGGDEARPLRLHMGYFRSLAEAERWAQALRARYPGAVASRVPQNLLQQASSGVPVLRAAPAAVTTGRAVPDSADPKVLTDTQVLRILENRQDPRTQATADNPHAGISLVGPEDTSSRRALKEAVAQGAPVSFAVQLLWSATDIDLSTVPSLSIFRAYTLYKVTTTREGRSWYCLRLGFFNDAISARQVAYYVRSHFTSVAVVPVTGVELTQSADCRIDPSLLADDFQRSIDEALAVDRDGTAPSSRPSAASTPDAKQKPAEPARPARRAKDSLEQTLEMLAASEMWNDSDSLSETGVRHLKVQVRKA